MSKNLFMEKIGGKAKFASVSLSRLDINKKNSVLKQFSQYLKANEQLILNANKKDVFNAKSKKIENSMINRLKLSSEKISQIRSSIDKIVKFKDPTGKILLELNASEPPRNITTLPLLKHRAETSDVTFGLLS